ncbi:lysozyme inhibitor LprI family protein [Butyrivibrio sp. VCD2006]|uniref:lysozyme inhibitor LprI family protein n=1 Tax=Butyrivibrio sp. VCD2006 TaxID=1280664 RepID=UPI00040CBF7A|nr:lysozyme inhibitor LprI family protein [Butyrivibrio sp. VCD2006]
MKRIKVALLAMGITAMMTGCTPTMQNEAVITDDGAYEAVSTEDDIVVNDDENNVSAESLDAGENADESSENEETSEVAEIEEESAGASSDEAAEPDNNADSNADAKVDDEDSSTDSAADSDAEAQAEEELGTIQKELAEVEAKSVEIEKKTWDVLPQQDLNQLTGEWYELWDAELNSLWSRIIEKVTPEKKEELLADQREWIKRKEAAIKASGEEALGGSLQPQLENGTAMRYTRKRAYFLAGVLAEELGEKFEIPAEVEPSLVDVDSEPEPQ